MDLLNRIMIPNIVMIISLALEINSLHKLRMLKRDYTMRCNLPNRNWVKKQVRLAVNQIILNTVYVTIKLPFPIVFLFGDNVDEWLLHLNFYLFCISYSIQFYLLFLLNNRFREEVFLIFRHLFSKKKVDHSHELIAFRY